MWWGVGEDYKKKDRVGIDMSERERESRGGGVYKENKIVIFGRVVRGGSTRIEKDSTSPRRYISEVT